MLGVLGKLLDSNEKEIGKLKPLVDEINSHEPQVQKLSDEKLKAKTDEFKKRLEKGETLDDILPEAFACVREAAKRKIGERHFDVQLIAGIALHQGRIAEQRTGEGKTLSATTAIYLNTLEGKGVHLATVNDYLARRDCGWMGPVYEALGLKAGCVMQETSFIFDPKFENDEKDWRLKHMRPVTKQEAYNCDVTYGTNTEFGFDYLRDNMVWDLSQAAQRGHNFAIVDEADSILIDEARTPLIISSPQAEPTEKYVQFARLIEELNPESDFVIDEKVKSASLTEHGILKVEKKLGVPNLYEKDFSTIHHIEQALRAKTLFRKDKDYVVKDNQIIIVDEFTGRLLVGRRYSEGLHQAIEAKEGVQIQQESKTMATVSFQNYFRLYKKLAGMTGTAATEAEEFHKIYKVEVVTIPTNRPMIRKDSADTVYKTSKAKYQAVANEVEGLYRKGQPVLIGTTSIEKNELLSKLLTHKKIPHEALNAKNHQREAEIISQAGKKGAITLATNIAGRGVDIILGGIPPKDESGKPVKESRAWKDWEKTHEEVVALGGLYVIGTERHESRRIDNQLRGRSGRQGDPGGSRFYVSLDDDIMRLFGGEQVARIMTAFKLPEDTPIEHAMVSKSIENAQVKVEGHNFDIRKHLVEYDDIANKQREIVYGMRSGILEAAQNEKDTSLREQITDKVKTEISALVPIPAAGGYTGEEYEHIIKEFTTIVPFDENSQKKLKDEIKQAEKPEKIAEFLTGLSEKLYKQREEQFGPQVSRQVEKLVLLSVIDTLWVEHIDTIDDLREGIGLRGYGQRDPLTEYKQEAFSLFEKLTGSIDYEITRRVFKIQVQPQSASTVQQGGQPQTQTQPAAVQAQQDIAQEPATAQIVDSQTPSIPSANPANPGFSMKKDKIGRNDPCPCGSGLKYKKCGLVGAPEHRS